MSKYQDAKNIKMMSTCHKYQNVRMSKMSKCQKSQKGKLQRMSACRNAKHVELWMQLKIENCLESKIFKTNDDAIIYQNYTQIKDADGEVFWWFIGEGNKAKKPNGLVRAVHSCGNIYEGYMDPRGFQHGGYGVLYKMGYI